MSRLARVLRSRITLALIGVALVGGGSAYWAVTSSAPTVRQAGNSLANTDPTSTASAEDPTATTDPGATATTTPRTPTPRATATPCAPTGQSVQWRGFVASVGATSFALRVGCARPTIGINGATTWPGQATKFTDLDSGWIAIVVATRQPDATYLASSVNATPPINN
jgi:hypothetical protein